MRPTAPLLALVLSLGCSAAGNPSGPPVSEGKTMSKKTFTKPSDEELQAKLSPLQYEVTQRAATEPPFRNPYWDNHEAGIYVDVATGEPLFSSLDKFESGTGWPSFTRPIEDGRVRTQMDKSHGMIRTEVVSSAGGSHLGHLFDDGPLPSRQRYCMNSASMRFIPVDRLEAEGYGEYRALFEGADAKGAPAGTGDVRQPSGEAPGCAPSLEIALLAGGCFWGMEDILRKVPGVLETEVGYMGGTTADPTYAQVSTGETGHAESIKVVFDPSRISYAELLEKWFFRMHDPTTQNRQGNDVGTQYRSAIFVTSDEQAKVAEEVKAKVQASGRWKAPIVTQIVKAGPFTKAEEYHQDYLVKHPGGYTCHFMRD